MKQLLTRYSLLLGLILMFVFTWPVDLAVAANSRGWTAVQIPLAVSMLVGYGFVAASLLATGIVSGRAGVVSLLRRFLIWRVGLKWYLIVFFLPVVLDVTGITFHFLLAGEVPDFSQSMSRQIFGGSANLWLMIIPFFLFDAITNGEEMGWRGFLLPRLQTRYSALISSLMVGFVWGLWHLPKSMVAGASAFYSSPFWIILLYTIAKAVLYTWVFNNTRASLLLVTLFHAAGNTSGVFLPSQGALIPITAFYLLAALYVVIKNGAPSLSGRSFLWARPLT